MVAPRLDLGSNPLLHALGKARRILIAGAGGGFDIYSGLPLYHYLKPRAEAVFLANLSFSELGTDIGRRRTTALTEVDADTPGSDEYFPERVLCRWFRRRGEEVSIFCFSSTGVITLAEGYRHLMDELDLDTIILVDGGTDALMRGDEASLGSPEEDLTSIAAVHTLDCPRKILTCLGFGVDGICHAHFLEAVAALQRQGSFLGAFSLVLEMEEAKLLLEAIDHAVESLPHSPSVLCGSVASALEGRFGDYHRIWRTKGNPLFINPLMSMYWSFQLDAVARRCLYLKQLLRTRGYGEVKQVIQDFREGFPMIREWESMPF